MRIMIKHNKHNWSIAALALAAGISMSDARVVFGQTSSLFRQDLPVGGPPLMLAETSWLYQTMEPPRVIKLNDLINVIVLEKTSFTSKADVSRRKVCSPGEAGPRTAPKVKSRVSNRMVPPLRM